MPLGAGKTGLQFPIGPGLEGADLLFPLHHHGEGRGLHPPNGGQVEATGLGVEGGHGPGAIDTDEPVALGPAHGSGAQAFHLASLSQAVETLPDGALGHGLQPQAAHRFLGAAVLGDVIEDQLPFAARVTGVDEAVHILALDQLGEKLEAVLGLLDGLQGEAGRDDGQVGKGPLAPFHLVFLRHCQFQQVADGGGQYEVIGLEEVLLLLEAPQGPGNILGHRWLLGDDELLAHGKLVESRAPVVLGTANQILQPQHIAGPLELPQGQHGDPFDAFGGNLVV